MREILSMCTVVPTAKKDIPNSAQVLYYLFEICDVVLPVGEVKISESGMSGLLTVDV